MLRHFIIGLIAITCTLSALAIASPWDLDLSRIKNAPVSYAEYSGLKEFPVPVVSWRRPGLVGSETELEQIKTRVIYPIIIESKKPISAIVVEFYQSDTQSLGLLVMWADGETKDLMIHKNQKGQYDTNAYKIIFAKPVP